MSIFKKIKNFLGIGGVKVELKLDSTSISKSGNITGKVHVSSKSDQYLLNLVVELEEKVTTGRGDDKKTKEYSLGEFKIDLNKDFKEGETETIEFSFPYTAHESDIEGLAKKGGALGAIGKLGKFADNKKSEFEVTATLDVKGVALDPNDIVEVRMIG